MSHDNNNHGPEMMFGAVLLLLALGAVVLKALKQFFTELGHSFEAFAGMMGSFTNLLWNTLQVVFLIALIIATIFCAIYFSIQYYKMVKDGVALREWVQSILNEFEEKWQDRLERFQDNVGQDVQDMDKRLKKALEKPEVAPKIDAPVTATVTPATSQTAIDDDLEDDSQPDELDANVQTETDQTGHLDTKTPEVTMSNPY